MEIIVALLIQIIKMFMLMFVGYVLYKQKVFNDETVKQLGNFLVRYIIPSVLVTAFIRPFVMQEFIDLGITFGLSILVIGVGFVYTIIVVKKDNILGRFASIFSNASFVGIPIATALFGQESVFYLSAYIVVFIIFAWTYGVYLMSEDKKEVSLKKVLTNPNVVAVVIGLIVYLTPLELPGMVTDVFKSIGSMNTPLSMIVLGTYLAKEPLKNLYTNKKCYVAAFNRLIAVPLLTVAVLKFVPNDYMMLKLIVLVDNSVPTANMLAIFAQLFDQDYTQGAHIVSFTTIMCIVTIPIILTIAQLVW